MFLGKKTPSAGWPGGKYRGEFALIRTSGSTTHAVPGFFREISIEAATSPQAGP